jgi:hypothetical protein
MPDRKPNRRRHPRHKRARRSPLPPGYPASHGEPGGWPGSLPESGTRFRASGGFAMAASVALVGVAVAVLLTGRALRNSSMNGGREADPVPVLQPGPAISTASIPQTRQSPPPSHSVTTPVRSPSAAPPNSVVASPTPSPATTQPQQPVVVSYLVVRQWDGGFEGEVKVINNGSSSLTGWQIVVALPYDGITSFWNASGYVSNHTLLLGPAPNAQPVGPGGVLRVFFVAEGQQIAPELCAFNGVSCS